MTSNPFDNQDFRKELSDLLDEKLGPLTTKVEAHEATINQQKGVRWTLGFIWTGLIVVLEYLFHRSH